MIGTSVVCEGLRIAKVEPPSRTLQYDVCPVASVSYHTGSLMLTTNRESVTMWREKIGPNSQETPQDFKERPLWRRLLSRLFGPCKMIVAYIGRSLFLPVLLHGFIAARMSNRGNDNRRWYLSNESWPKKVLAPSHPLTTSDPNIVNYPTMPHQHLYGDANYSFGVGSNQIQKVAIPSSGI